MCNSKNDFGNGRDGAPFKGIHSIKACPNCGWQKDEQHCDRVQKWSGRGLTSRPSSEVGLNRDGRRGLHCKSLGISLIQTACLALISGVDLVCEGKDCLLRLETIHMGFFPAWINLFLSTLLPRVWLLLEPPAVNHRVRAEPLSTAPWHLLLETRVKGRMIRQVPLGRPGASRL